MGEYGRGINPNPNSNFDPNLLELELEKEEYGKYLIIYQDDINGKNYAEVEGLYNIKLISEKAMEFFYKNNIFMVDLDDLKLDLNLLKKLYGNRVKVGKITDVKDKYDFKINKDNEHKSLEFNDDFKLKFGSIDNGTYQKVTIPNDYRYENDGIDNFDNDHKLK